MIDMLFVCVDIDVLFVGCYFDLFVCFGLYE